MLCHACTSLFASGNIDLVESKILSYSPRFTHHANGRALRYAATDGCLLCLRIWNNLSGAQRKLLCPDELEFCSKDVSEPEAPDSMQGPPRVTGQIHRFVKDGCYKFDFRCGSVKWHFVTCPSARVDDSDLDRPSWMEKETSADSVLAQARSWLENCLENHDCDKQTHVDGNRQQWYPTRLIDVGTSNEDKLQLVLSKTIVPSSPYMTLSHCWGLARIFRLLESNLYQLCSEIP